MKKRMLSVLVVLLVLFCVMPTCFAEEKTQDGLKVVLTTDKAAYREDEAITATLEVTNTNDFAALNVSLQNMIIDGYEVVEGSHETKTIDSLQPQESVALATTEKMIVEPVPGENPAAPEQKENAGTSESVKTGIFDDPKNILIAVGLLFLVIVLLYCLVKNNKGKRIVSILLGCAIVGSSMMIMAVSPLAAETLSQIELSTKITVEQKEIELKGVVSYCAADQEESLTIADILPADFPRTDDSENPNPPVKAWKTDDGNLSCFVSGTYIYFVGNGAGVRDDLRMPVTKSGNNYIFGSITFIMSGMTLERIEYKSDNPYYGRCNGVYNPPVHCLEFYPDSLELKVGETKTFSVKSLTGSNASFVLICPENCISANGIWRVSVLPDDFAEVSITGVAAGSGEIVFQPMLNPRLGPEVLPVTVTD